MPRRTRAQRSPSTADAGFAPDLQEPVDSAHETVRALVLTYDTITVFANDAMRRHGLSPAGRQALATLDGRGGPMSASEIAQRLLVTPASITSLLDTLVRRGLVTRDLDPDDRRRVRVEITDAGRALVDQFVPEAAALSGAVMAGLSASDRTELRRLLASVRSATATADGAAVAAAARPRSRVPSPARRGSSQAH